MDTYEAMTTRRSIRRFTQEKIDKELLMKCLNAARLAPSSMNRQPLEYILITENPDKIYPYCTSWAGYLENWKAKENERPTAYIAILLNKEINKNPDFCDVYFAAGNIANTAQSYGIGSCILAAIDRKKLKEILEIPNNYDLKLLIALGYPAHKSVVEDYKESVKYWEDEKGFHVPKRSLKDIVHEEKF